MDTSATEQQGRIEAVALTIVAPPTPDVPRDVHQHLLPPSPASAPSSGASCTTEFRASASSPAAASGIIYPAISPAWETTDEAGPAAAAAVDDPLPAAAAISSSLAAPICSTSSSSPVRQEQDRSPALATSGQSSSSSNSSSTQSAAANLRLDLIPDVPALEPPSAAAAVAAAAAAAPSPSTAPGIEAAAGTTTTTATTGSTTHITETRAKHREMRTFFGPSHHDDSTHHEAQLNSEETLLSPMTQLAEQDLPSSRSVLSGIFELEMESPTTGVPYTAATSAGGTAAVVSSLGDHDGSDAAAAAAATTGTNISEMIQGGPHQDSGYPITAAAAMSVGRLASGGSVDAAAAPPPLPTSSSSLGCSTLTRGIRTSTSAAPSSGGGAPGQLPQGPWGRLQEVRV